MQTALEHSFAAATNEQEDTLFDALLSGTNPVQAWREFRGLNQHDLADRCGLSANEIAELEGGASISDNLLNALGDILECDPDQLRDSFSYANNLDAIADANKIDLLDDQAIRDRLNEARDENLPAIVRWKAYQTYRAHHAERLKPLKAFAKQHRDDFRDLMNALMNANETSEQFMERIMGGHEGAMNGFMSASKSYVENYDPDNRANPGNLQAFETLADAVEDTFRANYGPLLPQGLILQEVCVDMRDDIWDFNDIPDRGWGIDDSINYGSPELRTWYAKAETKSFIESVKSLDKAGLHEYGDRKLERALRAALAENAPIPDIS